MDIADGTASIAGALRNEKNVLHSDRQTQDFEQFRVNPLKYLEDVHHSQGNLVVISAQAPLFSSPDDCTGAVAIFGTSNIREVLTRMDQFRMPLSISRRHDLPEPLPRLNSGLFSMTGEPHKALQRLLAQSLGPEPVADRRDRIAQGCAAFLRNWSPGRRIALMPEMRRLALNLFAPLIFGGPEEEALALGARIQRFFRTRLDYAYGAHPELRSELIHLGTELDQALRRHLGEAGGGSRSFLRDLAGLAALARAPLADDDLMAHGNILFMSSSEPIATALTWTLILLSQSPRLRDRLRRGIAAGAEPHAPGWAGGGEDLLDAVVRESLRLLPPNAIMLRVAVADCDLQGGRVAAGSEILISPYVAHRDDGRFPQPRSFRPGRWRELRPGPYEYFPFGIGARHCLGRHLAFTAIKAALSSILARFDFSLAYDQEIDWRMGITLAPSTEVVMELRNVGEPAVGGAASGPLRELVDIPPEAFA